MLVFPAIADAERSNIIQMDDVSAFGQLLSASGPQLFDTTDTAPHFEVLRSLVSQSVAYGLHAGRDLLARPAILEELIQPKVAT